MPIGRRSTSTLLALSLSLLWLTSSAAAACDLPAGEEAVVAKIEDGETLQLADGGTVKLIGLRAPRPGDGREELAAKAKSRLQSLLQGRRVMLRYGGRRSDRHGRKLAQLFVAQDGGEVWVQGAMLEAGLGLAYSTADNRACMDALLSREAVARAARRGLWAGGPPVIAAADLARLESRYGRFAIVEGEVAAVVTVRDWIYVNFAEDWRTDFTITIPARRAADFAEAGLAPESLEGRHIQVRGWLEKLNGPMIEADHPEQIALPAAENAVGGAAAP